MFSSRIMFSWPAIGSCIPLSSCRNITYLKVRCASVALWKASNTCITSKLPSWGLPPASTCGPLPSKRYRRLPSPASRRFRIFWGCGAQFLQSFIFLILYHILIGHALGKRPAPIRIQQSIYHYSFINGRDFRIEKLIKVACMIWNNLNLPIEN